MIYLDKPDMVAKAQKLLSVIEQRKELDKLERELKQEFIRTMGVETVLVAGNVLMILSERSRHGIDAEMIRRDLGPEVVKKYESHSTYLQLDVMPNLRSVNRATLADPNR